MFMKPFSKTIFGIYKVYAEFFGFFSSEYCLQINKKKKEAAWTFEKNAHFTAMKYFHKNKRCSRAYSCVTKCYVSIKCLHIFTRKFIQFWIYLKAIQVLENNCDFEPSTFTSKFMLLFASKRHFRGVFSSHIYFS